MNTGCHGLFVSYGFREKEKLIEAGAKIIFDNVNDLTDYSLNVEL
jgi:phosphoglycolate phosphatase-like HAD superfamily hydrolase